MDSKLKALKVVDLKAILANANLSCPTKSTKPDIIARIIASDEAINSYYQLYDPQKLVKSQPPVFKKKFYSIFYYLSYYFIM
jgi:SAP domain-containing ribonucleoprotein